MSGTSPFVHIKFGFFIAAPRTLAAGCQFTDSPYGLVVRMLQTAKLEQGFRKYSSDFGKDVDGKYPRSPI